MQDIEFPLALLRTGGIPADALRVGIATLGCKVNAYESEFIAETLKTDRWRVVPASETADLYIVNTCTVTREADRQARQEVRRAIRRNPDAMIVVTGCYAQMDPGACADIPGVDLVLGNDRKLDIHGLLPELVNGKLPRVMVGDLDENISLPDQLLEGYDGRSRAYVQIQQGCNQGCTFCIIHRARGPSRSLPLSLIRRQVQRLALNGYQEIVLCGVDLGAWGEDLDVSDSPGYRLTDLILELLQIEDCGPFRIRLSSIDPAHINERLVDLLAAEERLCPHLHVSLQSGNTLILKRMKRRYTAEYVYERIGLLRSKVPNLVLSADVMVGFPTETDEQFEDTRTMLVNLDIAYPHVFVYSERSGTPAARIPQERQVPVVIRKRRAAQLRDLAHDLQDELRRRTLGKESWVLPESAAPGRHGYFRARAENYLSSLLPVEGLVPGQWVRVRYTDDKNGTLYAHPIS
jgi:threonylcarbamoyladenosine tRNA methylthiotransferase MtaB